MGWHTTPERGTLRYNMEKCECWLHSDATF